MEWKPKNNRRSSWESLWTPSPFSTSVAHHHKCQFLVGSACVRNIVLCLGVDIRRQVEIELLSVPVCHSLVSPRNSNSTQTILGPAAAKWPSDAMKRRSGGLRRGRHSDYPSCLCGLTTVNCHHVLWAAFIQLGLLGETRRDSLERRVIVAGVCDSQLTGSEVEPPCLQTCRYP